MNIPLDRLYTFLHDLCDQDLIIYRFWPHGSKKLENLIYDLKEFNSTSYIPGTNARVYSQMATVPLMIAHDQEPLNYDLYNWHTLKNFAFHRISKDPNLFFHADFDPGTKTEIVARLIKMHLRSAVEMPLNIYDKTLLCHSELGSAELKKYQAHGFIGVYWWSHAMIARDWYRYAEHDQKLKYKMEDLNYDFLIYNRAWSGSREYRIKLADILVRQNLIKHCFVKFNAYDNDQHYKSYNFSNSNFNTDLDLESYFEPNQAVSADSADYMSQDYTHSAIEVVLETLFDDSRIHLTEKTLRPIACGKPFVLAATPGALNYLKSYGFKTFAPWIDESYDQIQDPVCRLQAISEVMKNITELPRQQKFELFVQLQSIADFNKQRFFSAEFTETVVKEFQTNLQHALVELEQYKTGSHYLWYKPINIKYGCKFFKPPDMEYIESKLKGIQ